MELTIDRVIGRPRVGLVALVPLALSLLVPACSYGRWSEQEQSMFAEDEHLRALEPERHFVRWEEWARLAASGPAGVQTLLAELAGDGADHRVRAAFWLGKAGDQSAIPALTEALAIGGDDDWRLLIAASDSLRSLHARSAIPALEAAADRTWFPFAAASARDAVAALRGVPANPPRTGSHPKLSQFFVPESHESLMPASLCELNQERLSDMIRDLRQPPKCGLRLSREEILFSSDHGEFGGWLAVLDDEGLHRVRGAGHPEGVFRLGDEVVVLMAGLQLIPSGSDCRSRDGEEECIAISTGPVSANLYRLRRVDDHYRVQFWKALLSRPIEERTGLLPDGRLLVSSKAGDVIVSPDGRLTFLGREEFAH